MSEPSENSLSRVVETASPYRPGFNLSPVVLAGRDDVLAAAEEALAVAALEGRMPAPLVLVGSRGVGKTVLLGEIAARAGAQYGWPRLHVEITSEPFTPDLVAAADNVYASLSQEPPSRKFKTSEAVLRAGIAGMGGELHFTAQDSAASASVPQLRRALGAAVSMAQERSSGLVLTIDEAQLAQRGEFAQLAAVLQEGAGADWPVVAVIAGLSGMRDPGRAVTYFERADWHEIGALDSASTRFALRRPAEVAGRPFDDDALELLAERTGGYPYAIQLYGHHAWRASAGAHCIDKSAALAAIRSGGAQLSRGLYANRWAQAPPREQEYLLAMAELAEQPTVITGRAVANRLGTTPQRLSATRDRLIKKGTLTAEGEVLNFAIPGMAQYVREHAHEVQHSRSQEIEGRGRSR